MSNMIDIPNRATINTENTPKAIPNQLAKGLNQAPASARSVPAFDFKYPTAFAVALSCSEIKL